MAADRIKALTAPHQIKPTSTSRHSAWRPNRGRRSTYQGGISVQTSGTGSIGPQLFRTSVSCTSSRSLSLAQSARELIEWERQARAVQWCSDFTRCALVQDSGLCLDISHCDSHEQRPTWRAGRRDDFVPTPGNSATLIYRNAGRALFGKYSCLIKGERDDRQHGFD